MSATVTPWRVDRRRRSAFVGGVAVVALPSLTLRANAQAWPARPIRLVTGYAPGGAADITAREIGVPLGRVLGQPIVVDNKPGASGTLAAAEISRAAPDGYTLGLLDNAPMTIVPSLRNPGYDPLTGFTAIAMVSQLPQVLVANPSLAANRPRELIELMRKQPGKLNYCSGSVGHLAAELLKARSQTFALHVPYRGGAPVVTALIAGEVHFAFLTYTATSAFIKSGQLKALGVSSTTRLPALPNVPTIAEDALPGYEAPGWFALVGPAGLPASVVAPIEKALAETMATPAVAARLDALGQTVATGKLDPKKTIATELAVWKKLVAERKIVVDI